MSSNGRVEVIELPQEIREALGSSIPDGQFSDWAVEALVVEAAREHLISRRKAASLLGIREYETREAFYQRHGLMNDYTREMVEQDFRAMDELSRRR